MLIDRFTELSTTARWRGLLAATTITVATLVSACAALPQDAADSSVEASTSSTTTTPTSEAPTRATPVCERTPYKDSCAEWTQTSPVRGDAVVRLARAQPPVAANMLCSLLPVAKLDSWFGPGWIRYIATDPDSSKSCVISSSDKKLNAKISLDGARSLAVVAAERGRSTTVKPTEGDIVGVPAIRAVSEREQDGKGRDVENVYLALLGDKFGLGVLRVVILVGPLEAPPDSTDAVDRARLGFRDQLLTELVTGLRPR